jgi:hypothetical protein
MMRVHASLAVILGGCADLPAFDEECGNGVIDTYEDCDNPDTEKCNACLVVCSDDEPCSKLRGDYRCGADDRCHAPSGELTTKPITFPFLVQGGGVSDLDGDEIGDVVGFSDITIEVRFGDLGADLSTQSTTLLPYSNPDLAIRPVPGQIKSDLLVPTPDGIAGFTTSGSKKLVAVPFSTTTGPGGMCATMNGALQPISSFELDKHRIGFVARERNTTAQAIWVGVFDVLNGDCAHTPMCNIGAAHVVDAAGNVFVDHYETLADPLLTSVIAVAVSTPAMPAPTQQKLCVARFDQVAFAFQPLLGGNAITQPLGPIALARTTQAAVCPTLFVPHAGGIDAHPATGTADTCALGANPTRMSMFGPGQYPAARIPLSPPITGTGPEALVVLRSQVMGASSDIYALIGNNAVQHIYHSPRGLYPVASGDLDGDGRIEAVAAVYGGPQGQPDLDVLYRTQVGGFVAYRIVTQSVPRQLKLGDFDGNGLADIAYTEGVGQRERLLMAYGTRDRPLPAVEIAVFDRIVTLSRIDLPDSIERSGLALDDLLVVDQAPMTAPILTILHGNPQRTMLAYYDPRSPFTVNSMETEFYATIPGNFDGDDVIDVLALERRYDGMAPPAVYLWVAPGIAGSQQLREAVTEVLTDIAHSECTPDKPLCSDGVDYLRWPRDGRSDVVIAADALTFDPTRVRTFVTIDPAHRTDNDTVTVRKATGGESTTIEPQSLIFTMWGADIDGVDGDNLVVSTGRIGPFGGGSERVLDCSVDAEGVVTGCRSLATRIAGYEDWTCRAAERGTVSLRSRHVDPPLPETPRELLALCGNGIVSHVLRLRYDGTVFQPSVLHVDVESKYQLLSVGDVNGDRVDDVAGIWFDSMFLSHVDVFFQCASHDKACRDQ